MSRRLIVLAVLAVLALAVAATVFSSATYTTSSETIATASTDTAANWLHLYSESTDPDGLADYAHERLINGGVGALAASGSDMTLAADMGVFPDRKLTYTFNRTFTIETPDSFPDAAVTAVRVTLSTEPDPGGEQLISKARLSNLNGSGASTTMTLAAGQKRQVNVTISAHKKYVVGETYYPSVVLTLTMVGGSYPSGYYQYSVTIAATDGGGS